jgi:hypothetical protein
MLSTAARMVVTMSAVLPVAAMCKGHRPSLSWHKSTSGASSRSRPKTRVWRPRAARCMGVLPSFVKASNIFWRSLG